MPKYQEHIEKYEKNRKFYSCISTNDYMDWSIVVLFYRSVHLIESILAKIDVHSTSHDKRKNSIYDNLDLFSKDVVRSYVQLENLSKTARYEPAINITYDDLRKAEKCEDEIYSWHNSQIKKNT